MSLRIPRELDILCTRSLPAFCTPDNKFDKWQALTPHTPEDPFALYTDRWDSADVNGLCQNLIHYNHVFPKSPPDVAECFRPFNNTSSEHIPPVHRRPRDAHPPLHQDD